MMNVLFNHFNSWHVSISEILLVLGFGSVFVVTFILFGCLDEVEIASHDVTSPNPVVNELLSHLRTLQVGPYDFKDMRWSDMVGKITDDARRALRDTGFKYSFGFSGGPGVLDPQKEIGSLHIPRTSPYEAFRLVAERFDGKIWYERGVIWMMSKDRERPIWSE